MIALWCTQFVPAIVRVAADSPLTFGLVLSMIIGEPRGDPIMQFHQANTLEKIESAEDVAASQAPTQPASMYPWDFLSPNRDEVLALLKPDDDRKRTIWLVAGALVAGFGLGWAGGFSWYGSENMAALNPIIQTEAPSRRIPDIKSGGKTEGARKTASTPGLQTPPGVSTVSATLSAKPQAISPAETHLSAVSSNTSSPAIQATATLTERGPMVPETRPTTIEGWIVLEVRGGTAVLEGPDGVRMATRGDAVPGIGRIDSIVRWGNRWIVATASGLIATP